MIIRYACLQRTVVNSGQLSTKKSLGDRVKAPFFRLQMSQAPGIRRFFEWISVDTFEASSPLDSAISSRKFKFNGSVDAVEELVEKFKILVITHQTYKLPKTGIGV